MKKIYSFFLINLFIQSLFAQTDFITWQLFKYKQSTYYLYGTSKKYIELIHNDFIKFEPNMNFYFNVKFRNDDVKCYDQIISGAADTKDWGILTNTYFGNYRSPSLFSIIPGYTVELGESRFDFLIPSSGFEKWNMRFKNGAVYDSVVIQGQGKYVGQVLEEVTDTLVNYHTKFYLKGTRIYPIKDSTCFILSKNYGFKKFLSITNLLKQSIVSYNIFGLKSSSKTVGFQPPKFEDYFNYKSGDVILRKEANIYTRDSITSVSKNNDSVIYIFDSQTKFIDNNTVRKDYNLKNVYSKSMLGLLQAPTSWPTLSNFYKIRQSIFKELNSYTYYYALPYELIVEGKDTIIRREYRYEGTAYDTTYCSVNQRDMTQGGESRNLVFDTKHGYDGFVNMFYKYNQNLEYVLVTNKDIDILGYKKVDGKVEGSIIFPPTEANKINNKFEDNKMLTIFPNPTHDLLTIQSSSLLLKILIYNSNGIKVIETTGTETIDVSTIPVGLYLLKIWDAQGNRLIKKFEKR